MAYVDKNLSHKNGSGTPPEVRRISVDSRPSSKKRRSLNGGILVGLTSKFKKHWKPILGLVIAVLVVFLLYGYITTKNELNKAKNPTKTVQDTKSQLVEEVGNLIELPQGETPSTATVSDASKLQNQEFFANAKNGDKVLVYSKAGRAVLYRPSTNKVIEYTKVDLSSTKQ